MRIVGRILLVLIGAIAATVAAGLAAAFGGTVMHATLSGFTSIPFDVIWNIFVTSVFLWVYLIFWIVFIPYVIAAIIAEIFGLHSLLVYLIGAVVTACLSPVFAGQILPWFGGVPMSRDLIVSSVAAGFAAGFVYWLIAGRNAGKWKST